MPQNFADAIRKAINQPMHQPVYNTDIDKLPVSDDLKAEMKELAVHRDSLAHKYMFAK